MGSFAPGEIDTLAKAFQRAMEVPPPAGVDAATARKLVIGSLLEASDRGVKDETILTDTAILAVAMYRETEKAVRKNPF
jgi:hypothetical protein